MNKRTLILVAAVVVAAVTASSAIAANAGGPTYENYTVVGSDGATSSFMTKNGRVVSSSLRASSLAALAEGVLASTAINDGAKAAQAAVFCLNDSTVMEGDDIGPLLNWLPGVEPQELILDAGLATFFNERIAANGGSWTFRMVDSEGFLTGPNTITAGPCGDPTVSTDRSFWLCYANGQTDPGVYSRSRAIELYEAGYRVPFAVRDPLSGTNVGNGMYLTCTLPAGYVVQAGVAVSTGGGDLYTSPSSLVAYMLGEMPLDYTRLAARG